MICTSGFAESADKIIVCRHKEGVVHEGCCRDCCSLDGRGHANCPHAHAVYEKRELVMR